MKVLDSTGRTLMDGSGLGSSAVGTLLPPGVVGLSGAYTNTTNTYTTVTGVVLPFYLNRAATVMAFCPQEWQISAVGNSGTSRIFVDSVQQSSPDMSAINWLPGAVPSFLNGTAALIVSLSAGSHVFDLRAQVNGGVTLTCNSANLFAMLLGS